MKLKSSIPISLVPALVFILIHGSRIATAMKKVSGSSFKSTDPSSTLGSTSSFDSYTSTTYTDYGSTTTCTGTELANERFYYVDVTDPSIFLSKVKQLPIITSGNTSIRLEIEEPSDNNELLQKARRQIGEPEKVESAKKELATLLEGDSKLDTPWQNEAWLIRFLRLKKYNVRDTYELITAYYYFKLKNKKIYDNIVPKLLLRIFDSGIFVVMPNRDQLGRRILIFNAKKWDAGATEVVDLLKTSVLFGEVAAYEPVTQIVGVQIIIDMEGFTSKHVWKIGKKYAKLIMEFIHSSSPFKVERFHIINEPFAAYALVRLFSLFLNDAMQGEAIFYGSKYKKLEKHIGRDYLPEMYGGTALLPDISTDEWNEILEAGTQEYEKIASYGVKSEKIPVEEEKEEEYNIGVEVDKLRPEKEKESAVVTSVKKLQLKEEEEREGVASSSEAKS